MEQTNNDLLKPSPCTDCASKSCTVTQCKKFSSWFIPAWDAARALIAEKTGRNAP